MWRVLWFCVRRNAISRRGGIRLAQAHCGILVGPDELRVLSLRSNRGVLTFEGAATHELSLEERDAPGAALRTLLRKLKPVPETAVFCLPKEQANLHHSTLPSSDPNELKEMARFEAERNIPFNADRHTVGYHIMRNLGTAGSEALLASTDGPIAERVFGAAISADMQPQGLTVSSVGLMNAFLHAMPEIARHRTIMMLSIGLSSIDLVFSDQGRLLFSRSVPIGLRGLIKDWLGAQGGTSVHLDPSRVATAAKMIDMMEIEAKPSGDAQPQPGDTARQWAGRLVQELRRSYDYARRELACPQLDGVVIASEGAMLRNLDAYLYKQLGVEVAVLNPLAAFNAEAIRRLPFGGLELTVCFGAAIQDVVEGGYRIDLTPVAHYQKLEKKMFVRRASVTGAILLVTAVLAGSAYVIHGRNQEKLAMEYAASNEKLYPYVTGLKEEEAKLGILEEFLDDPCNALVALDKIFAYPAAPDRVSIRLMTFAKSDQVTIEGHAVEIQDLNNFAEYLRGLNLFDSVTVNKQELRSPLPERPELYEFHIQCMIPKFESEPKERESLNLEALERLNPGKNTRKETEFVPASGSTKNDAAPPNTGGIKPPPPVEAAETPATADPQEDEVVPPPPAMPPNREETRL